MNRKEFIIQTTLLTAGAIFPFQKKRLQSSRNFQLLRRHVGIYTNRGGTIGWLANKDAMIMVDSQYIPFAKDCLNGLQKKTSQSLNLLVNTHHHDDHTSGNPFIKPKANKTVAQKNVSILMQRFASKNETPAVPETTFSKSWNINTGNETVHATYYGRAHTAGDAVIYFEKANVVHVGDLVFNRMNPFTDRPAGASIHHWIKVLDNILKEYPNDAIFIFGHGNPKYGITGNKKDLHTMKNYLSAMVEHVEKGIAHGKLKKAIVSLKKMPGFKNFVYGKSWTLKNNLEVIYAEVKKQKWLPVSKQ